MQGRGCGKNLDLEGGPLPLSVYWNHGVRGKSSKNLWGSISYGQNLAEQGVRWVFRLELTVGAHLFLESYCFGEGLKRLGLREPWWRLASLRLAGRAKAPVPTLDQNPNLGFLGFAFQGALQRLVQSG